MSLVAAERWRMQFFHDEDREQLQFSAIAFCSPARGIAIGMLTKDDGRSRKPTAMATSNGGQNWTPMEIKEAGHALYFFDETSGWMLTESGIWFTDECGRSWRRVHKHRGLTDIRFVSRDRGWVIGRQKTMLETSNGGKTWSPVKAAEALDMDADRTAFTAMEFPTPKVGMVTGRSNRPRRAEVPLWLDTEPERRRERPTLSVVLETKDGGATWLTNKVSMFGRISKIRMAPNRPGLALLEFDDYFDYPSELFSLDTRSGKNERVLRRKDLAITDIAFSPVNGGTYYAAAFSPEGSIFRTPVPGRVRVVRSTDANVWVESPVDYRAVARRVMLAENGGRLWLATDTGMILNLVQE
jgi:hypothetical protein